MRAKEGHLVINRFLPLVLTFPKMELPTIPSAQYPKILSWCSDTMPLADVVYKSYLSIFIPALLSRLQYGSSETVESLNSLPIALQQKIIEAPETYALLNLSLRNEIALSVLNGFIRKSVAVERCRLGESAPLARLNWSATGDYFADQASDTLSLGPEGWRNGGRYFAKTISSVPIDHESIFCRVEMPVESFRSVSYGVAAPFTLEEAAIAEDKVISAFVKLELVCPFTAKFFGRFAKSVILRKNANDLNVFQSASRNAYVGQLVLLNPQACHVDEAYIAESLVHESIHALMWRQEILSNFLIDPSKDMGTVRSPWSGEEIFYYTLLQAGFVWFGIANFWRHASATNVFPAQRVEELYLRAIKGFRGRKLMSCLERQRSNLQDGIIEEFNEMTEAALALPNL